MIAIGIMIIEKPLAGHRFFEPLNFRGRGAILWTLEDSI